jgi:hypothetical protein
VGKETRKQQRRQKDQAESKICFCSFVAKNLNVTSNNVTGVIGTESTCESTEVEVSGC